jgi:hypothetical protein
MSLDTPSPPPGAYSIWLRARSAVSAVYYPPRIAYTIRISGVDGDAPSTAHYRASFDSGDGTLRVFPISDEEEKHPPPPPRGINVRIFVPIGHPLPPEDLLGVPHLDPTYMFGVRFSRVTSPQPTEESGLRVIAVVSSQPRGYSVVLLDTPTIDGVPTYHLRLTPLINPKANRLRELWVGTRDYLPRQATISGNFTIAPLVDVPWFITFSVVDGVPYIESETAAQTLYLAHRRVVRNATIAFKTYANRLISTICPF